MKPYLFTLSGMTCHSCESLISLDLEEAGLPKPKSISAQTGEMIMDLEDAQVDQVKQVIANTNKYRVESVKPYEN